MKQGGARLKKKNSRTGRFLTRGLAVSAAFVTAYMLVLPAITKSVHLSGELDGLSVRVETNDNVLPVDTKLQLGHVRLPEEEPADDGSRILTEEETERILAAALGGSEEYEAKILQAVDISLNYNGNEIEPEDHVRLFLKSDLIREAAQPVVVHLTNAGEAELLEARATEDGETLIQFGAFEEEDPTVSGETAESLESESGEMFEAPEGDADGAAASEGKSDETAETPESDADGAAASEGKSDETAETPESDADGAAASGGKSDETAETPESDADGAAASEGKSDETAETPESDADGAAASGGKSDETAETPEGDADGAAVSGGKSGEMSEAPEGDADGAAVSEGESGEKPETPDSGEAADIPADGSGAADGNSDEISVNTDEFSVYAIVDLVPKELLPGEELKFTDSVGGMDVCVTAPYTAFPEGTTMKVSLVENENVIDNVSETVQGEFDVLRAVDITFFNAEGGVIEPAESISVVIKLQEALDAEKSKLIHIGASETSVMDNATFEEGQVQFDSDEFSTYVIIITLGDPGEQVYHGDGVTITVSYGADANLPKGTEMTVRELEEGTEEYDEYFERTRAALNLEGDEVPDGNVTVADQLNALLSGGYDLLNARFFDIELSYQGEKVEPAVPVNVTIEYDEPVALAEEEDNESELKIVHFADEGTEIISDVTVEGAAVSYQQGSFSVTAAAIAGSYGNAGWFNNGRMEIHYGRVKENGVPIFELAYIDGKLPGDAGFPVGVESARFAPGTTIEEIIKALSSPTNISSGEQQFLKHCTVVDFMMHDTYVVDDSNRAHNGYTETISEKWEGPKSGNKTIAIKITRNSGFEGPLLRVNNKKGYNMHMYSGVIIDNAANQITTGSGFDAANGSISEPVAILIEGDGLVMMMGDSHITDSQRECDYHDKENHSSCEFRGTGIKLVNGGSVELFHQSYIERMAVGIEQIDGKTRLKDSPNPLGNRNTVGVALHPGQSIGKWINSIEASSPVPVFLRNVGQWKSGDIVMDSGFIAVNNQSVKVNVAESDVNKLVFENVNHGQQTNTRMGLEYFRGSGEDPYPVIRFYIGTVLNTRTGEWYATLRNAVMGENPVKAPTDARPTQNYIQDGDTLVFYGNTVEGQNIDINYNLTIRSSYSDENADGTRHGNACTATLSNGAGITVAAGKTVTFGGTGTTVADGIQGTVTGTTGGLTLNGAAGGSNIITNNGTLHLRSDVTLANAKKYGVSHQGDQFHLYEGAKFTGNGTEVFLKDDGDFITLETGAPNGGNATNVELGTVKNGRDVVLQGAMTLGGDYLEKFPLRPFKNQEEYEYVYNLTGSDAKDGDGNGKPVLELKLKQTLVINITKVDSGDNSPLEGAAFQIQYNGGKQKGQIVAIAGKEQKGSTDEKGCLQLSVREGDYTLVETAAPNGYVINDTGQYSFTVKKNENDSDKLEICGNDKFKPDGENTYSITVENTVKSAEVQFVKTDGGNGKLAGAQFELYDVDPSKNPDAQPIFTGISGGDGIVTGSSADSSAEQNTVVLKVMKTYYLKETAVPIGYIGIGDVTIQVTEDTNSKELKLTFTGSNSLTYEKNGENTYVITVPNNPGAVLPSTGGTGTWMLTMAGILMMTAAIAVMLWCRKKAAEH